MREESKEDQSKKYILHAMGYDSKKFGVLEKYILSLALKARDSNFEIVLIYNKKPRSKEFLKKLSEANINYYVADALALLSYWSVFYRLTKTYKPILVHSHFQPLLPSFYGWLLNYKYRWNTNRLMLIKDFIEIQSFSELKLRSKIYRYLINIFTNKFFCVSEAVLQQYRNIFPQLHNSLHLLHNGVPFNSYNRAIAREALNFDDSTIYVCCIAFASKIKGVDILLRAFNDFSIQNNKMNIKLCLIGLDKQSNLTQNILLMIEDLNLKDKIIDFGIINNIQDVLPAMDIYVQPSRSESLSNALIEAGLYGIPAIGTNVGGIPEVILDGETGYLFKYEDHQDLSKKILFLANNKTLRENMGEAAKMHVMKNFMMEEKINELLTYYLNYLKSSAI